ncbi:MAG TPA: phosphoribosylformylglycinamidine synthase subunit PurS [Armatimonadetes bacterium]|nr:phosphoribosylformylglycinamidine synthase subunit PurS [Armatimonadota bacterium]
MARYLAKVYVVLKPTVLDAQGLTIGRALRRLGYEAVEEVRVGKFIRIWLNDESREGAKAKVEEMCKRLLANPVLEDFEVEVEEVGEG